MQSEFMTTGEVAKLLDMSPDNIRYHERCGHLLAMLVGKQRFFFRRDVERFRQQRGAQAAEKMEKVGA